MTVKADWVNGEQFAAADANAVAEAVNAAYTAPAGGIPKTDLAAAVQTSLGKADSAVQSVSSTSITDATVTGRSLLTATDAAAVRAAAALGNVDNTSDAAKNAATATLTGKSIALGANTVTGTLAQFNTAVTDADLVSRDGVETLTQKTLTNPQVNAYTEGVTSLGTVAAAATLSIAAGTVITATLTASTATTFTMPTPAAGKSFTLLLRQPAATGNGTATFTGVKWPAAGAPTITAAAGKMDILTFVADGTNWYGSAAQGFTP